MCNWPLTHRGSKLSVCVSLCVSFLADLSASAGSKVLVVTANAWNNEQSFVSVVQTNVDLYGKIIPNLARLSPQAVLLIASQPGQCAITEYNLFSVCTHPESWLFVLCYRWIDWYRCCGSELQGYSGLSVWLGHIIKSAANGHLIHTDVAILVK